MENVIKKYLHEARLNKPIRDVKPRMILLHYEPTGHGYPGISLVREGKTPDEVSNLARKYGFHRDVQYYDGKYQWVAVGDGLHQFLIVCTPEYFIKEYGEEEYSKIDSENIIMSEARLKKEFKSVYGFDDLEFHPHPNSVTAEDGGIRASLTFPNGRHISVIGGAHFYGDGKRTFEIRVDNDEVMGWLTKEKIDEIMKQMSVS